MINWISETAASLSTSEWLMLATAFFTFLAAVAAWRGASATENAMTGQLMSSLFDHFWSDDFRQAGRRIGDLKDRFKDRDQDVYRKAYAQFHESDARKEKGGGEEMPDYDDEDDQARRRVKAYYYKLYHLKETGLLDEGKIRDRLTSRTNVKLLFPVVERFAKATSGVLNPGAYEREREIFDYFYHKLYEDLAGELEEEGIGRPSV